MKISCCPKDKYAVRLFSERWFDAVFIYICVSVHYSGLAFAGEMLFFASPGMYAIFAWDGVHPGR